MPALTWPRDQRSYGQFCAAAKALEVVGEPGAQEIYHVHVDDDVLHIVLTPDGAHARPGPAPQAPDLVIRTDQATFAELGLGRSELSALAAAGRAQVTGNQDRVARAARLFSSAAHPVVTRLESKEHQT